MYDKNQEVLPTLIKHHISGQLKVAPEHMAENTLKIMNKPSFKVYSAFAKKYKELNEKEGKKQFLVPYLISSHPGCTLKDAIDLTDYLKGIGYMPKQVQDFYPTPSTRSSCIYYTGIDPDTFEKVYVPTNKEKQLQRALLQYRLPQNKGYINEAYILAGLNKKQTNDSGNKSKNLSKRKIKGQEVFRKSLSSKNTKRK
jgi:uncharacterized radical SAM protein YgiQ